MTILGVILLFIGLVGIFRQEAARTKSELLAYMSHEIRNPMTAILGWAAILRERGDLSKSTRTASPERNKVFVDADILDLVPKFVEMKRKEVAEIRTLLASNNFTEITRLGHNMKGSGSSYGLRKVSELGGEIESLAKQRDAASLQGAVSELESHLVALHILPVPGEGDPPVPSWNNGSVSF